MDASIARPAGTSIARRATRLRRPAGYLATILVVVTINFFLPRLMPGDPLHALVDPTSPAYVSDADSRSDLSHYYGLDEPLPTQYWHYLSNLAHGDLGRSIDQAEPVSTLVLGALPWTLLLIFTSLLMATGIGVLGGVRSGWRRGRAVDRGLLSLFLGVSNVATYVIATVALIVFAVDLNWFPVAGAYTPFAGFGPIGAVVDVLHHLALPAIVLAISFVAESYLLMRAGMVTELGSRYLLLGRAKGLTDRRLMYRHAARNAMLPVVTLVALQLGAAVGTTIFVETVFAYPGVGGQMTQAIGVRDYPVLQGCLLVLAFLVVTGNFAADWLYARLDPRTRR
ncbi:MAG TPA: ABC transporter permease [Candidatus Dormibacteraeota bacterium]|nr:ABC transporter permease [Candidatus Dormibacteraeota bacterium]